MSKISVVTKMISSAVMIALLIASFSTASVVAKGNNQGLESKWDQLVDNYNRQRTKHESVHNWVDHWLDSNRDASDAKKEEVMRHLVVCNSSIVSAGSIVSTHAGFDSNGKVVDKGLAKKSIQNLARFLRQHAGSVKNLNEHVNN